MTETERLLVFRGPWRPVRAWCGGCAAEVCMVTPEGAATLSGVSTRTVYRQLEANQLHFRETPEGLLLICLNSLAPRESL